MSKAFLALLFVFSSLIPTAMRKMSLQLFLFKVRDTAMVLV